MDKEVARDLDETRRLLYMAMAASRTDRYNLAGTLVSALVHHQNADEPAGMIMDTLIGAIEGNPEDLAWVLDEIAAITARLELGATPS
jgi:hypothetical protein